MQIKLCDEATGKEYSGKIKASHGSLFISVEGYGEMCSNDGEGSPIAVEVFDGKLRVIAWQDINEEEGTVLDMSKAKESLRIA